MQTLMTKTGSSRHAKKSSASADIATSCARRVLGVLSCQGVGSAHSTTPNMFYILQTQGNKLTVAQLIRGMRRECAVFTRVTVLSPEPGPEVDFIKVPG